MPYGSLLGGRSHFCDETRRLSPCGPNCFLQDRECAACVGLKQICCSLYALHVRLQLLICPSRTFVAPCASNKSAAPYMPFHVRLLLLICPSRTSVAACASNISVGPYLPFHVHLLLLIYPSGPYAASYMPNKSAAPYMTFISVCSYLYA